MEQMRTISGLVKSTNLSDADEFVIVDKSVTSGSDASSSGRTSKIRFDDLKDQIGSQGQKGDKGPQGASITGSEGEKGQKGERGSDGFVGSDGEKGSNGEQGVPGEKGQKGDQGDQGQPGNSITGPEGDKGQKGQKGDFQKGDKGEVGEKGSTGAANSSLALIYSDNIKLDPTLNKITKVFDAGQWNANVTSTVGFSTFNLSFKINQTNKNMAMGVSVTNSTEMYDNGLNSIFLCFHFMDDGTYHVKNVGRNITSKPIPYEVGQIFNLSFDKLKFTITQGGISFASFGFNGEVPNYNYSLDSSFYDVGTNLTEFISFTSGANSVAGQKGETGAKGQKGEVGVNGQKGELGVGQKGQKGQKGEFGIGQKGQKGEVGIGQKGQKGQAGIGQKGQKGQASTTAGPKGPKGSQGSSANVSILTGSINNNQTIPLPSGYTEAQCKWIVSSRTKSSSHGNHNSDHSTHCYTSGRKVHVRGIGTGSATAQYMIIGRK